MLFTAIVTALDLFPVGDRALPVVAALARSGALHVELVTVLCPGQPVLPATSELERRVGRYGLERTSLFVFHDESPGGAICDHVTSRDGALLVVATTGGGAWGENQLGTITDVILRRVHQPVLVVGPRAEPCSGGLLVVVDGSGIADAAMPIVEAWVHTFPSAPTRVVEMVPPDSWPTEGADPPPGCVDGYVGQLGARGIAASGDVLRERDPAPALAAFAATAGDAVLVVTSPRYPGAVSHWYDTTRMLIRFATRPVLVVPADRAGGEPTRKSR